MGGGTAGHALLGTSCAGLSPRGRGNRDYVEGVTDYGWSIPAWAGEPPAWAGARAALAVYPRVGGGTSGVGRCSCGPSGLSPRGRGNQGGCPIGLSAWRSIPAWAGEPSGGRQCVCVRGVYPRVGGGTDDNRALLRYSEGLSPRGRGNLPQAASPIPYRRSIPAWAGEPVLIRPRPVQGRVYPRVGGGTRVWRSAMLSDIGLSPRGRGNPAQGLELRVRVGSIPAWAGEPSSADRLLEKRRVYPRVGGGTELIARSRVFVHGLSPRGRGNHPQPVDDLRAVGSIPAWAGEPLEVANPPGQKWVYPRVGGGTRLFTSMPVSV